MSQRNNVQDSFAKPTGSSGAEGKPQPKKRKFFRHLKNSVKRFFAFITDFDQLGKTYGGGYLISIPTIILVVIGTISVISATSVFTISVGSGFIQVFARPVIFLVLALAVFAFARLVPISLYKKLTNVILVFCLVLQCMTLVIGSSVGGNQNWISIAGFTVQPSEFCKFGLILFLAKKFSSPDYKSVDFKTYFDEGNYQGLINQCLKLIYEYALPIATCIAILAGKDMGTFMIIASFIAVMMFVSGIRRSYLWILSIGGVLAAIVGIVISPSRLYRVMSFVYGDASSSVRDLQSVQSIWGLASGGLVGLGPGASREKWGYLPAARTDFIYSVIGEEFGLVGTILILILFIMLAYGLFSLMYVHQDMYVKMALAGISAWIIVQAIVNIFVVIGYAPVLGVPLPLISSGGSALISTMAALGFALRAGQERAGLMRKGQKVSAKARAIPVGVGKNFRKTTSGINIKKSTSKPSGNRNGK